MRLFLTTLSRSMLLGAAIGAVAGAIISGLDLRALLDGAFIGAAIGGFFGLRAQILRRSATEAGVALWADKRDP